MSAVAKNNEYFSEYSSKAFLESFSEPLFIVHLESYEIEWKNIQADFYFDKNVKNISELEGRIHVSPQNEVQFIRNKKFNKNMLNQVGLHEEVIFEQKSDLLFDVKVHHYLEGNVKKCVVSLRNVTEKRKLESELLQKHQELLSAHQKIEKQAFELKSTQEALVQTGKLAALGELAAGIAHELNQPLQTIRGYSQELSDQIKKEMDQNNLTGAQEYLEQIVGSVDKMAKIIQALRAFAVQSTDGFQEVQLNEILEEVVILTHKNLSHQGIHLEFNYKSEIPNIFAHPTQLQQVFMNFILNAKDALLEKKDEKNKKISIELSRDQECVRVSIKDNGMGITEENKSKILNPFFTTKEVGKGMGLGLSLSYGILKKINGTVLVESEYKKGTEFIIKIPIDFRKQTNNKGENHDQ